MWEYLKFWLAKPIAEFLFVLGGVALIAMAFAIIFGILALIDSWTRRSKKP